MTPADFVPDAGRKAVLSLNLGEAGEIDQAARLAIEAAVDAPNIPLIWIAVAMAALDHLRPDRAVAVCRRAVSLSPAGVPMRVRLAQSLRWARAFDDAAIEAALALCLDPCDGPALSALAQSLSDALRRDHDLIWHNRAVASLPDQQIMRLNRSMSHLARGNFAAGFEDFEARWVTGQLARTNRYAGARLWAGEIVPGARLVLTAEQGFGDTVHFIRFAKPLANLGFIVGADVPPPLKRLIATMPWLSFLTATNEAEVEADFQCPMMSVPKFLQLTRDTIEADIPYLSVPAEARRRFGDPLRSLPGPRIGLVWSGALRLARARAALANLQRSLAPEDFVPLGMVAGTKVALQYGSPSTCPAADVDGAPGWLDFADAAAAIEAMDVLVSVDTAMVHVAGALGKPVFMVSRFNGCWRWFDNQPTSPWYPGLRLFAQPRPGDWLSAVLALTAALDQHLAALA